MSSQRRKKFNSGEESFNNLLDQIKQIFDQVQLSQERSDLIKEIDQAILRSTVDPTEVLNLIVEKGLSKTDSYHGQIIRYQRNKLKVVACTEDSHIGDELPLNNSLCGRVVKSGKDLQITDVSKLTENEYVRYHEETLSELVVPIKTEHSQKILGVLDLERDKRGEFDQTSKEFARLLAGQAAIAIRHTQTWAGVNTLHEISTSLLSGNLGLEESYQEILNTILEQFDFEFGQILRVVGNELIILASSSPSDVGLRPGRDTSICGRYLIAEGKREILIVDDIQNSSYKAFYLSLLKADKGLPMRSEMIVPLIEDNRVIGALNLESPRSGIFSDFDRSLLGVLGSLMASAISATFTRRTKTNQHRIQEANLALTYLGTVAQSFLHRFGNSVGDVRGRLRELQESLNRGEFNHIRERPINDFIDGIINNLEQAKDYLDDFSNRFDPNHPTFKTQEMDIELVAKKAIEKAEKLYADEPIIFALENYLRTESKSRKIVSVKPHCLLSEQVYEVIDNLLNNAVEAIKEKNEPAQKGEIKVILDFPDPFNVLLRIKDNGIGIDKKLQQKIFQFKYTTRKGTRASHGVGLWYCDLYMKQFGGKISVESDLGKGATFSLQFPTILADTAF